MLMHNLWSVLLKVSEDTEKQIPSYNRMRKRHELSFLMMKTFKKEINLISIVVSDNIWIKISYVDSFVLFSLILS